jgi:hypothetical protein
MVNTVKPQRLGDIAQHAYIAYFRTRADGGLPTGRYEEDGDFYLDFPGDPVGGDELVRSFRRVIALNLPADMIDYEQDVPANPGAMWTSWQYGPRTEAIARLFWPGLKVHSMGNPRYQQGGELAAQLKAMRQALVAAEAAVRCGTAFGAAR